MASHRGSAWSVDGIVLMAQGIPGGRRGSSLSWLARVPFGDGD